MFKSDEGWASIPKCYVTNMIYTYGDVFLQKKKKLVCNTFRRELVQSIHQYTIIIPLKPWNIYWLCQYDTIHKPLSGKSKVWLIKVYDQ